jgi:hypothetical protein
MPKATLYHQERFDSQIHTGFTVEGVGELDYIQPGKSDDDPVLRWFVDLRCTGSFQAPQTEPEAFDWLNRHADLFRDALSRAADRADIGIDHSALGLQIDVPTAERGLQLRVVVAVHDRAARLDVAPRLRRLRRDPKKLIRKMAPLEAAREAAE